MSDLPVQLLLDPIHLVSLGFGSGIIPVAPGTFGTMLAIVPYLLIAKLSPRIYPVFVLTGLVGGTYSCQYTEIALGVDDHPAIVWDEFVGFWITMIGAPPSWKWILAGFALFRAFDIVKPWPVMLADTRLQGGLGVMLDDVLAGLYAMVCLKLLLLFIRRREEGAGR